MRPSQKVVNYLLPVILVGMVVYVVGYEVYGIIVWTVK